MKNLLDHSYSDIHFSTIKINGFIDGLAVILTMDELDKIVDELQFMQSEWKYNKVIADIDHENS